MKETIKTLKDKEGKVLEADKEKVKGIVRDIFRWDPIGRQLQEQEMEEKLQDEKAQEEEIQKMETKARAVLGKTSNKSPTGPDGISYWLIKVVFKSQLGKELMREVATNLVDNKIPTEWQQMKVVMISKLKRDLTIIKNWHPINLINCIGKLGEKVVADQLPDAGLFYRHQFGSIRGRSATEAVCKAFTKAQHCLGGAREVACGFWDIKGGFQNVKGEKIEKYLNCSKKRNRCQDAMDSEVHEG